MLNICLSISSRDKHLTDRCSATTVYIQVASCRFKPVLFRLVAVVIALSARDRSLNQFHSTTQVSYCCRYMCHSHTQCKRGSAAGLSGTLSFSSGVGSCDIAERERGREGEGERRRCRATKGPWPAFLCFCLFLCLCFALCQLPFPWLPQTYCCRRTQRPWPANPQLRKHEQLCWLALWRLPNLAADLLLVGTWASSRFLGL